MDEGDFTETLLLTYMLVGDIQQSVELSLHSLFESGEYT